MSDRATQGEATRSAFLKESAWMKFSSPLFSTLLRAAADDAALIELGTAARPGQPVGLLFPTVAHFILLKSPDAQLAQYFASLSAVPLPPQQAFAAFREFCLDNRREFAELLSWRTVNTNLVERSSCIMPALADVRALTGQPLALVEICCSSGLNLLFDQYHYDYGPAGTLGNEGASIRLSCKLIGPARPPLDSIPEVIDRVGVDLVTIDASDPLECLWMEAALCPEWREERERLRAALKVRAADRGRMLKGDALSILPGLFDQLPGPVCVLHTYSMGQWSTDAWERLDDVMRRASRNRDIHRITIDFAEHERPEWVRTRLAHLAAAGIPLLQKSFPSRMEHTWYSKESAQTRTLAQSDGFGTWLDWQVA
jgi:hypothetical protein